MGAELLAVRLVHPGVEYLQGCHNLVIGLIGDGESVFAVRDAQALLMFVICRTMWREAVPPAFWPE